MAEAVVAALRDAGFHAGAVVARNAWTGTALADQYGYTWRAELGSSRPQLLVNATPAGMSGGPAADGLPAEPEVVDTAETVFDSPSAQTRSKPPFHCPKSMPRSAVTATTRARMCVRLGAP